MLLSILNTGDVGLQPSPEEFLSKIQSLNRALAKRGIYSKIGRDFRVLKAEISRQNLRHNLLNQFDPDGVLNKSKKSFWLCGYAKDGELVSTQAAQLLDLRRSSVAAYLAKNKMDYVPAAPPVIPKTVRTVHGPRASCLRGRVVYHGEMWLHPKFRDRGTAHLVVRFGVLCLAYAWNPDAVFGLMNWALASEGFGVRAGYNHHEPLTMSWERKDARKEHQVWAVYADREDLQFMIDFDSVGFAERISNGFD